MNHFYKNLEKSHEKFMLSIYHYGGYFIDESFTEKLVDFGSGSFVEKPTLTLVDALADLNGTMTAKVAELQSSIFNIQQYCKSNLSWFFIFFFICRYHFSGPKIFDNKRLTIDNDPLKILLNYKVCR